MNEEANINVARIEAIVVLTQVMNLNLGLIVCLAPLYTES